MSDYAHNETELIIEKMEKEINHIYSGVKEELEEELNNSLEWKTILNIGDNKLRLIEANKRRRLEGMIKRMSLMIQEKNSLAISLIQNTEVDIFALNYNWGAFFLEHSTGYDLGYLLYNKSAIKELLQSTTPVFTEMAYKGAKDISEIQRDLKRELTKSILKGDSIREIAKRIDKVTDKNNHGSIRIARTESGRIQNSGRMKAYEDGVKKGLKLEKKWISTLDGRTRHKRHGENHRTMMGETVPIDEKFSNGLMFPSDPKGSAGNVINCRCTVITEFIGVKKGASELELDEKLKKMTFEEWEESKEGKSEKKEPKKEKPKQPVQTKKEVPQKGVTPKKYNRDNLNTKSVKELTEIARTIGTKYYESGAIKLGGRKPSEAIDALLSQKRSKTSLMKDIISMQRSVYNGK